MKKIVKRFVILSMLLIIGFTFVGCGDDAGGPQGNNPQGNNPQGSDPQGSDPQGGNPQGGNPQGSGPQKVTYVSTDDNGNKYTLEIDESGARSARSAAQTGDTFKLTVEYTTAVGSGTLAMKFEYSGTVDSAKTSGEKVSLTIEINDESITITIVGAQMTVITGKIVNNNGQEIADNPGDITPVSGGSGSPTITTSSLLNGKEGIAYNQTFTATGDTPITYSLESGTLPAGLSLAGTTGTISGTPTKAGTSNFTVKATNAKGSNTKALSITITAASVSGAKPATPTGLKSVVLSSNSVRIDWTGDSDATGYYVYRSDTSSGNYTNKVGTVSASSSPSTSPLSYSFTDTGLAHAKTYYYKITAYNSYGESAQTGYLSPTTKTIVPTGLKSVVLSSNSVRIDWTGNEDATGYYIYRSDTSSVNYTDRVGTVLATSSSSTSPLSYSFTDTGLAHNKTYYYKLSAYNSHGESAQTSYLSPTTKNIVPTGVKTVVLSSSSIRIDWTGNEDATGYYIYRSDTSSGNYTNRVGTVLASSSSTLSYSYTNTGLGPNTTYYYKVSAYNSHGESAQTGYVSGKTQQ